MLRGPVLVGSHGGHGGGIRPFGPRAECEGGGCGEGLFPSAGREYDAEPPRGHDKDWDTVFSYVFVLNAVVSFGTVFF